MAEAAAPTPGVELERLTPWLAENVAEAQAPFALRLLSGGRSNLTYEVSDATGRRMVLRRPPLGQVLSSAHDMGREYRIMSALAPTAVPVPRMLAYSPESEETGAQFYVMDYVDGAILREEADVERAFSVPERLSVADSLIDSLCRLHEVDPDDVGLGELSRREGYIERQLRRWYRQWELSRSREVPALEEVHRRLQASIPPQRRLAIVHGDYRIDNMVFAPDTDVRAVLDWELCTLGDPLADLGLLLVYWVQPGEDTGFMLSGTPTLSEGFPTREHLLARYAEGSGAELGEISYYVAFGYWKLACIAEGIYARYSAGAMADDGTSTQRLAGQVPALAEAALAAVERL
ncbi:MAG TPA: phosphotransferase family protein [Solirubrobacteraceae bacterium]|jgi:aminoglycoside phosphotransferase (APT) family kinase protein|nr:phosphotransferase family protein [Solirubrobacteraceae bacterium]